MKWKSAALRLLAAFGLLAALLSVPNTADAAESVSNVSTDSEPPTMTDQIILVYEAGAARLPAVAIERRAGAGASRQRSLDNRRDVIKLAGQRTRGQLDVIIEALSAEPGVAAVEPDTIMVPLSVPNDPSFPSQWDLGDPDTSGDYGINAPEAWDITTGSSSLTVAVLDTGYVDHADLAGRILGGYDFVSDSRIGNDGNGRDSDPRDPGDWISSADTAGSFFRGCTVSNSSWHGTHVAGTIGAATNNGSGIAGINRSSKLIAVRVLGKCGGYTSDIVDGVRWAAGLSVNGVPANPNPAKVINLSLGGSGSCSSTWQNAVNAVTAAGTVVVVAAGNSNANAANYSPAGCSGVISVAATGKSGSRSYYSNYGSTVEIAAPGGDRLADNGDTILSTLNSGTTTPAADSYARYQGTSMAAPHVAGVVSLMLSVNPNLSPTDVTQIMQSTARAFPSGSSCGGSTPCGPGIIDAAAAVAASGSNPPPPPPPPPTAEPGNFGKSSPGDGATRQSKRTTLRWGTSSDAANYEICVDTTNNDTCDGGWSTLSGTSTRTSLSRRTTYYWQVRAVNNSGTTDANGGSWWSFTTR